MTRAGDDVAALREQAALWALRLQEAADGVPGGASREQCEAECETWCAEDPRRRTLLRQLQGLWLAAADAAGAREANSELERAAPRSSRGRRRAGAVAGLLSVAVLLGVAWKVGIEGALSITAWRADERSAVGQIRRVTLPDGSRLVLNSGTAVDLAFGPGQRRVRLLAGEVMAEVAPDAQRPFSVQGRDGEAIARGTRYLVRQDAAETTVTVLEHSVDVVVRTPSPDGQARALVEAGQSVRLNASGAGEVHAAPAGEGGWAEGRLVFIDAPLPQVLAELARYRVGLVRPPAGELASLRFTGVLPVHDTEQALAQLERALLLRVRRATDFLVWVEPANPVSQE